jgi:hypothetical protein
MVEFELIAGIGLIFLSLSLIPLTVALWVDVIEEGAPLERDNAAVIAVSGGLTTTVLITLLAGVFLLVSPG